MKNETILKKIDRMIFELAKENLFPKKISFSYDGFQKFKCELQDTVLIRECIEKNSVMGIPFETDIDQEEDLIILHEEFFYLTAGKGLPKQDYDREVYGKIFWNEKDKEIYIKLPEECPVFSYTELKFIELRKAGRGVIQALLETPLGRFLFLILDRLSSALNEASNRKHL